MGLSANEAPMTLTLNLPPDLENTVRQQAAKAGQDVGDFVLQAVNEKLAQQQSNNAATAGLAEVIDEIHRGQQARAYQGRSAEEIDAVRQEGEADYEKRMNEMRPSDNSSAVNRGS
jgi:hypothetical protein